jgi:hypothetical protein
VDGGQGAGQPHGLSQLRQGQIGPSGQQPLKTLPVVVQDLGLAPGPVVLGTDVPGVPALLEELLDHAQRHAKAHRDLRAGAFAGVLCKRRLNSAAGSLG